MTNPDELERLARAATPGHWRHIKSGDWDLVESEVAHILDGEPSHFQVANLHHGGYIYEECGYTPEKVAAFIAAANPATILALLSANREMREAASLVLETNDRIVDAMLAAKDERTAASISLKGSDEFTATLAVLRSALTTQRGDGE